MYKRFTESIISHYGDNKIWANPNCTYYIYNDSEVTILDPSGTFDTVDFYKVIVCQGTAKIGETIYVQGTEILRSWTYIGWRDTIVKNNIIYWDDVLNKPIIPTLEEIQESNNASPSSSSSSPSSHDTLMIDCGSAYNDTCLIDGGNA